MMRTGSFTIGAVLSLVVCLVAGPQRAAAQQAQPPLAKEAGGFIQTLGTRAIDALGPAVSSDERTAMFRRLLSEDFDLNDATRFVLGPYGRQLTPAQSREFAALFRDALAQAYAQRLGKYAGQPFRVTGARPMGGDTAMVSSEVVRSGGQPVKIGWQVARHDGHWLITDVYVDGVSQKLAQRNAFIGVIQRNGGQPAAAIAALRQHLQGTSEVESGSSSPPAPAH
jgi:phospholipid transport system substrate-binding protein